MRVFLSLGGILTVMYFTYISYELEKKEQELCETNKIVYAQIIELNCGNQDHIKFKYQDKEIGKRIYLSEEECNELNTETTIGIKIDKDENIVFANSNYNDWSEAESLSIITLGALFIFCILFYGIVPELRKSKLVTTFKNGSGFK